MENMQGEREIKIVDLILDIFEKWRALIVWMVVLAAFSGVLSYAIGQFEKERDWDAEIEALELDELQMKTVLEAYGLIQDYEELLANQYEYIEESILMQLDPNSVPTVTLVYEIDNHFEITYPTIDKRDDINSIYTQIVNGSTMEKMYIDMATAVSGSENNAAYYEELVSFSNQGNGIMRISVSHTDIESALTMAEVVQKYVEDAARDAKEVMGDFDFTLLSKTSGNQVVTSYRTVQKGVLDNAVAIQTSMNNYRNKLDNFVYRYMRRSGGGRTWFSRAGRI